MDQNLHSFYNGGCIYSRLKALQHIYFENFENIYTEKDLFLHTLRNLMGDIDYVISVPQTMQNDDVLRESIEFLEQFFLKSPSIAQYVDVKGVAERMYRRVEKDKIIFEKHRHDTSWYATCVNYCKRKIFSFFPHLSNV